MTTISDKRKRATRYIVRRGARYLYRHWSGEWRWTHVKADARVFRRMSAAQKRAAVFGGDVVAI